MSDLNIGNAVFIETGPQRDFWVIKTVGGDSPANYPVAVLDVNGNVIGQAATKQEYMNIWNSNLNNVNTKGFLIGEPYPFVFEVRKKTAKRYTGVLQFIEGGDFSVPGLKLIKEFIVRPGAPMEDGDTEYTNPLLAGKKILVIASGLGLPWDDLSGADDYTNVLARHVKKSIESDTIFFYGGVVGEENIKIYETL